MCTLGCSASKAANELAPVSVEKPPYPSSSPHLWQGENDQIDKKMKEKQSVAKSVAFHSSTLTLRRCLATLVSKSRTLLTY